MHIDLGRSIDRPTGLGSHIPHNSTELPLDEIRGFGYWRTRWDAAFKWSGYRIVSRCGRGTRRVFGLRRWRDTKASHQEFVHATVSVLKIPSTSTVSQELDSEYLVWIARPKTLGPLKGECRDLLQALHMLFIGPATIKKVISYCINEKQEQVCSCQSRSPGPAQDNGEMSKLRVTRTKGIDSATLDQPTLMPTSRSDPR